MEEKQKYVVIARKFRPQTFEAIVGQEHIVTTLKNALRFRRLAHAYLFCGLRGTGKTTLARLFAKALNCQKLTEAFEPCNQCTSCVEISSGRSLDVLEIDGASNRGIDDIREINETVGYAPSSGKYKIYIIDEVHMLTKEAFNALLKTLEEPPSQVKFFFATTEPHKVPSTITSRCQRFELGRIPEQQCVSKLSAIAKQLKIDVQEEALYLIAARSEGSLRDAESLLDQLSCSTDGTLTEEKVAEHLGLTPKSSFFALDEAIAAQDHSFAFRLADQLFNAGRDLASFVEGLLDHFRLLLLITLQQKLPHLSENDRQMYATSAKNYTKEQCLYILDFLMEQWESFSKTSLKRITLEMILLHLLQSRGRVPLEAVVQRLIDLEKSLGIEVKSIEPPAKLQTKAEEPIKPIVQEKSETVSLPSPPIVLDTPPVEKIAEPKKQEEKKVRGTYLDRLPSEVAYHAQEDLANFGSARLSQIEAKQAEREVHSKTMTDEEDRFGKVAASQNSLNPTERGIEEPIKVVPKQEEKAPVADPLHLAKLETLLRFAAVELEGKLGGKNG